MKAKLLAIWQRICWHAWDYSRRRELARRASIGQPGANDDLTPDQRRIRANEARQLLEHRDFREAFGSVEDGLNAQALACDPTDKERAQSIIIAMQMLAAVQRSVIRKAEDGYMAEAQILEIERRKRVRFQR